MDITGEDQNTALHRFMPYLRGEEGIPPATLCAVLRDAGWSCVRDPAYDAFCREHDGQPINEDFWAFWENFEGTGVFFYEWEGHSVGHAIVVRSGGAVHDPERDAPEEETIRQHFDRRFGPIQLRQFLLVDPPNAP